MGPGIGIEQHEFHIGQRFVGVEELIGAVFGVENIQDAVCQALINHRQTTFPGQELPVNFHAQALEHFDSDVVVDTFGLTAFHVDVGGPGFGDDTQLLAVGKCTQASEQQGGQ
ncbi:hypothetical protein D3C76_1027660 [compost metagenome]